MGTEQRLSIAFYPQINGHSKRTIQTLKDMLRACALDYVGTWDHNLPLVEFAYNNSYHSSIGIALLRHCMVDAAELLPVRTK